MSTIALVTIGQAPRVDISADVLDLLQGHLVIEHGALDDLDPEQIAALEPLECDHTVVSRLRDGSCATMGESRVLPHVQRAIDRAAGEGADTVLLMCTGRLPGLSSPVPLHTAEDLAREAARDLARLSRLGVVVPEASQRGPIRERWLADHGLDVVVVDANPYTASLGELVAAAIVAGAQGADALFLDCVGYSERMAQLMSSATDLPVYTARSLAVSRVLDA